MASPAAAGAIEQYLRDVWNVSPLVFENEQPASLSNGDTFVLVEIFGRLFDLASIGAEQPEGNLWREEGTLWLHVMMPVWTGTATGRQHAWQLARLFLAQPIAGIEFRRAQVGMGDPVEVDGAYARMTVSLDWTRDE